ncbi:hypothetical protein D9758_003589 [Tetrapyrgos nigripes]|uniref:Uncharacterized protein n=1 Tax=Tetrapyrgos nigripes TaxID=182062 RepID=A0A8H5LW10_9AGAR|nr:hypothetical protein D9758_003589 [Tetrapyrgos nigripes]
MTTSPASSPPPTMSPNGLLYVYAECGPNVTEEKFHDWYDNEHAPARLTVPGFLSATRYKSNDFKVPTWLATYDLTSTKILSTPEYAKLRETASQNERDIIGSLLGLGRGIYELIDSMHASGYEVKQGSPVASGKFVYAVHMQVVGTTSDEPREIAEQAFLQWYSKTRVPLLSKVPGWMRSRIFRLVDFTEMGGGARTHKGQNALVNSQLDKPPMKFLALHEWDREGADVTASHEFKATMVNDDEVPWQVALGLKEGEGAPLAEMEDRRFSLYKAFEH